MRLKIVLGPQAGRIFNLPGEEVLIGRSPEADVPLLLDRQASRSHATLKFKEGVYWLADAGSSNGTFVEDQRVTEPVALEIGQRFRIGESVLQIEPMAEEQPSVQPPQVLCCQLVLEADPSQVQLGLPFRPSEGENIPANRVAVLRRVTEAIGSTLDLPHLLQAIMDTVFEVLPAERGCLLLVDERTKDLRPEVVRQRPDQPEGKALRVSQSLVRQVVEEQTGVLMRRDTHTALCAPLVYRSQPLGALYVETSSQERPFRDEDLEWFSLVANQAAWSLETVRLYRKTVQRDLTYHHLRSYLAPQIVEVLMAEPQPRLDRDPGPVTILCSGGRGFTALSHVGDSEPRIRWLNDYLAEMTQVIFQHDGAVLDRHGEAILAAFGWPLADPAQVEKAVRAALRMQDNLARWNEKRKARGEEPMATGIGIHQGPAHILPRSISGHELGDYTLIGATVHTAWQLHSLADGGEIIVSHRVYEQVQDLFPWQARGLVETQGQAEPLRLYAVQGPRGPGIGFDRIGRPKAAAKTEAGRIRQVNEDAFFASETEALFVVADGLGGLAGGAQWSRLAVEDLVNRWRTTQPRAGGGPHPIPTVLETIFQEVHAQLGARMEQEVGAREGGTTLLALVIQDRMAYVAHVGDSRAYLLRNGNLEQWTADHSMPWMLYERGQLALDQIRHHPMRHILTQCLGQTEQIIPQIQTHALQRHDRLLLCTDGVWEPLTDEEIQVQLQSADTVALACQCLLDQAQQRGGTDNLTAIVIDVDL